MIAVAPTAMKIARSTRAMMMPHSRASCWYFLGTPNLAMMMRKMNRLSMLREYSVNHPAKNSVPYWAPEKNHTPMPNSTAALT